MRIRAFFLPALGQVLPVATLYFAPEFTSWALVASGILWGLFGLLIVKVIRQASRITIITDAEDRIKSIHPPSAKRRTA